ncbi:MAG: site-2 protease family protein [Planctomycetota bacterium]|nr:site-2 protease family protein [Planctomycetota bacterium]
MMQFLGDPGTTRYDLRFSVMGIPVRVHPLFWLVGALLGSNSGPELSIVANWIGCLFVSILVHELGHALAARSFGWPPDIVLHGFGGFARYSPGYGYTRSKAIWITFAGPLAGFGLFAIVYCAHLWIRAGIAEEQPWAQTLTTSGAWPGINFAILQLEWINLFWGLFNLLPVFPLDGGQICSELLNARENHSGRIRAHQIGMITAGVVAAYFLNSSRIFGGLMFGSLAYQNYQIYTQLRRGYR